MLLRWMEVWAKRSHWTMVDSCRFGSEVFDGWVADGGPKEGEATELVLVIRASTSL